MGPADQEYSVQLSLRQEWTDDRLAFGKMRQYKDWGLNSITLTEQERIWKPDLFFRNEKEGHFHKIIMPNVLLRIKSEGQVLYSIRISLVLACPMDLKYYPLDKQNCTIEMASYGYLDEDLKFLWKEQDPVQIAKPLNLPRFTLETYDTAYCTSRTTTGAYSCLRIDLMFKREFSYYLIQIYIPCCMLVIVSWVSFWLDPNAIPARVSLGVTTLLTMATQISGINASLPPVSYTKAIDVWTGVCLTFVFGALLEFALVNYASRSDQHKREMLTTALTQTQQMRWREATAAAAAAGTAPPTSPPPDENSPSMLVRKNQQAFFGAPHAFASLPSSAAVAAAGGGVVTIPPTTGPNQQHQTQLVGAGQQQQLVSYKPDGLHAAAHPTAAAHGQINACKTLPRNGVAVLGTKSALKPTANKATVNQANSSQTKAAAGCQQQAQFGIGPKTLPPHLNCGLQYLVSTTHAARLRVVVVVVVLLARSRDHHTTWADRNSNRSTRSTQLGRS
jgi:cation transporter family protein